MATENPQPTSFTPSDLRERMLGGAFWVGLSQVVVQGVRFVGLLILVRLLLPGDFGLVAMCFVVMSVTAVFTEMGLPNALIQARELTAIQRSSTAWVFLSLAVAGGLVALVFAGWVWNAASAVANWSVLPGDGARFAFARDATALLGAGGITAIEVGAAVLYLAGLAYVAVACLRRRRGAAFDVAPAAEVSEHYSAP